MHSIDQKLHHDKNVVGIIVPIDTITSQQKGKWSGKHYFILKKEDIPRISSLIIWNSHCMLLFPYLSVKCPAGEYKSSSMSSCARCAVGKFSSSSGASSCTSCAAGTYSSSSGSSSCTSCGAGKESNAARTSCGKLPINLLFSSNSDNLLPYTQVENI